MSDDYRTEKVYRSAPVRDLGQESHEGHRRHLPAHAYQPSTPAKPEVDVADVASVLGLPAGLVSQQVLEAMTPLLAELERLRWRGDQADRRQVWLEQQADRHSVVPCLTRRAFMRELDSYISAGGLGVVALVQVAGVEALRQLHGLAAGEGALRHICANIIGTLRASDVVGCLGGSDFAILLPAADYAHARGKLDEIIERMSHPPYVWLGQRIPLQPAYGLHQLGAAEGAEQAVAAADRHRRGLG